jgi:tRNA(Arg) A34 adenosine deaminase TadA
MKSLHKYIEGRKRLKDVDYMQVALEVAQHAKSNGDVPIAAVLVWGGGRQLVEHDTRYTDYNPLNHAIINLLNKAAETIGRKKLKESTLYCTLEPNLMCAMAIETAGVKEVIFGAYDDKEGFMSARLLADHTLLDITAIGGILGQECCLLLPESMQEHVRYEDKQE